MLTACSSLYSLATPPEEGSPFCLVTALMVLFYLFVVFTFVGHWFRSLSLVVLECGEALPLSLAIAYSMRDSLLVIADIWGLRLESVAGHCLGHVLEVAVGVEACQEFRNQFLLSSLS